MFFVPQFHSFLDSISLHSYISINLHLVAEGKWKNRTNFNTCKNSIKAVTKDIRILFRLEFANWHRFSDYYFASFVKFHYNDRECYPFCLVQPTRFLGQKTL
jgi:hypothetical protein